MLEKFDYKGVTLHDGNMKRQFDEVREFYLRLPNDDLLRGYRLRAGRPAPGVELGGCYLSHNTFGQVLSGLARMYAATGDVACKDKAIALMQGWAQCIETDGYFMIEKTSPLIPYQFDKILVGLIDIYIYCGDKNALKYMNTITDWAIKHMSREKPFARPTGSEVGEWYTLSENLNRAYLATGDTNYRDFAKEWEYTEFWDMFLNNSDIFAHPMNGGWYHAYSHVNSFSSLATAYMVNGDSSYLQKLKNAYEFMWNNELFATGGFGPGECLFPRRELEGFLATSSNHFETQCGSWAVFKMCKYLTQFTGDAKYGDWTELMTINGIGASVPMEPDGSVFYYSEYNLAGSVKKTIAPWACCSGTRPQAVADFHDIIYYKKNHDIYVNLFVPSTVKLNDVSLTQSTRFPETQTTEFVISTPNARAFTISVRNPGWLAAPMKALLNGKPIDVTVNSSNWVAFNRSWRNGDKLTIELPMSFSASHISSEKPYPAAIMYGPVTMATRADSYKSLSTIDINKLTKQLIPAEGQPLNYRVKSDASLLVRPFYQFKAGERYFMYLDPEYKPVSESCSDAVFSPWWQNFGQWMTANIPGATAEYTFTGTGIKVLFGLWDDAGQLEASIDGQKLGIIDEYGPERGTASEREFTGLAAGKHTLLLTVLPSKTVESKGNYVNISGFAVIK